MSRRPGIVSGASGPCRFLQYAGHSPSTLLAHPCRLSLVRTTLRRCSSDSNATAPNDETSAETAPSDEALLRELERREGFRRQRAKRKVDMKKAQRTYQFIAGASSLLVAGLASAASYFKFIFIKPKGSPFPWPEFAATMMLVACGTASMEMYARFAHRAWWHDLPSGWALHKSHHAPRTGPFEANDIFAVANAIPAFTLCFLGFVRTGIVGAVLFGFGLGMTLFGMAYMFVHDGLVHKRFPVGPLANVPFMKRVAAAHMLHHADKYGGKPFGMFLGPQEISHIPEAVGEMEKLASIL